MSLGSDPYIKNVALKSVMEQVFGSEAWYELKETSDHRVWKKYFEKTLKSYIVSATTNIEIFDKEWLE